jgi:hypothetical protein
MGMVEINSINELFFLNEEDYPNLKKGPTIYVPFTLLIVLGFVFSYYTSEKIDSLILERGIASQATITYGSQTTTRSIRRGSSSSYHLQLSFKLQNGKIFNTAPDVSGDVYDNVSLGQSVEVRYLPENPSIFKVMAGDRNIQKFMGVTNRDLKFNDLEKIMILPADSIQGYLNSISLKWDVNKSEDADLFINESKKEAVGKSNNGNLFYKGPGITLIDNFIHELKITDKKDETIMDDPDYLTKHIKTFITDKYIIQHVMGVTKKGAGVDLYLTIKPKS